MVIAFDIIWWQALIAICLALIPVIIWISILRKNKHHSTKTLIKVFILGTLTVLPLIYLKYLWFEHPDWDIYVWIDQNIGSINAIVGVIATFVLVGFMEEFLKMSVLLFFDKSKMRIQTINEAVKFSILGALGFAFSENIYYFYTFLTTSEFTHLFSILVFRSTFTVCAHISFSAIVGYYYGIGKFSKHIVEQENLAGGKYKFAGFIKQLTGISLDTTVRYQKLLTGFFIAVVMHTTFNFFLQTNMIFEAMLIIFISIVYVLFLMHRKAGHLILLTNTEAQKSLMIKSDEDVVLELIGMWFNDGKYQDVIEICERLLMRDPDNNIVKLFRAKAMDKAMVGKAVNSIKSLFSEKDEEEASILETMRRRKKEIETESTQIPTKPASPEPNSPQSTPPNTDPATSSSTPQASAPSPQDPAPPALS